VTTLAHLSDVHFGRIRDRAVVDALVEEINGAGVDAVVVSGDLTQRARKRQYRAASEFLARFDAQVLVVPGNHDVYAWWYPAGRLGVPLRRYRRYISRDLTPTVETEDASILGINSAHGWTVKGGRIGRRAQRMMREYFGAEQAEERLHVLVVHHHLTRLVALGKHDVARGARSALKLAASCGVDLVLCGHLHRSAVEAVEVEGKTIVVASAGTATSDRGRSDHAMTNFYNQIHVHSDRFEIEERRFDDTVGAFQIERTTRHARDH
jgi:3',5'-cyclic AMP phosphodiesterase CpdA